MRRDCILNRKANEWNRAFFSIAVSDTPRSISPRGFGFVLLIKNLLLLVYPVEPVTLAVNCNDFATMKDSAENGTC